MKAGIMQPYFFPYIGYFQLINSVEKWVVFDVVQYMRHQWVNRNRILHPSNGWQYIIVPLKKHGRDALIKDVEIVNDAKWRNKILAQLVHYKYKARYYKDTIDFVRECLLGEESDVTNLAKLNTIILKKTCQKLNISFNYSVCSSMDIDLGDVASPGDWALKISEGISATEYINVNSGSELFDSKEFESKGITLKYLNPATKPYWQLRSEFVSGLSIIDVMMWNSEFEISLMLNDYKLYLGNGDIK